MVKYSNYPFVKVLIAYGLLELFVVNADTQDELVDPFDILNYDRHSKTMLRDGNVQGPAKHHDQNTCEDSLRKCEETLNEMKVNTFNCNQVTERTDNNSNRKGEQHYKLSNSNMEAELTKYMRRFVNILIDAAGMKHVSMEKLSLKQFEILMMVTDEQLILLRKFSRNEGDISLQALDDVFTNVLKAKSSWVPENISSWLDYVFSNFTLQQFGYTALMLLVPLTAVLMTLLGYRTSTIVSRGIILVFVVGFIVTYNRVHKVAEIRSYIYQKKYSEVPEQCRLRSPSEMSWYQWLLGSNSFSDLEVCQKHYEALWMDPSLHVSPDVVLSEMMTVFLLHPVDHISNAIVKFSNTVLGGLPFGTNWIVYLLSLVMLIAIMGLVFGLMCGGQVSFCGLHVGLSKRRPISTQETQQPSPEPLPPSDRQAQMGYHPPVAAPPVFNININLPRRSSLGRSDTNGELGSNAVLKLTNCASSEDCASSGKVSGDEIVPSKVQRTEDVTTVSSACGSKDVCAGESIDSVNYGLNGGGDYCKKEE